MTAHERRRVTRALREAVARLGWPAALQLLEDEAVRCGLVDLALKFREAGREVQDQPREKEEP